MKVIQSFLRYYSLFLSVFITLGAAAFGLQSGNLLFFVLFLPVSAYLLFKIFRLKRRLKLLLYYNFILVTIMAVMGFAGASSIPQFLSAILFLPLAFYFWRLVWPKRSKKLAIPPEVIPAVLEVKAEETKIPKGKIQTLKHYDLDRRKFIKLIGSAGLTVFLFSIFTRKAQAAFFGSVPGPGTVALKNTAGTQIDPAEKHPTDGYKIARVDDSTPAYYGFLNKDGAWFIMREESSGIYKYAKGDTSFSTNWGNRGEEGFDYYDFNVVF